MRLARAATVVLLLATPIVGHDMPTVMAQEAPWAVLHVAQRHPRAGDRYGGTLDAPLASIGEAVRRALENRRAQKSTRVQIHPGIYRESIELHGDDTHSAARIVLEGAGADDTVIAGADVWDAHLPTPFGTPRGAYRQ